MTVDAAAAARARVDQWAPLADESGVTILYEGPERLLARSVPLAIEQIIDNYIDNALSVSPEGSTIVVRVESRGDCVDLHVLDEGPGLSPEDCARAYDRFWRASSQSGGSGLGLAIVAQLAAASGGSAQLTPRSSGGLDASATLPGAASL